VSKYRLDTVKLAREVDRARRAGESDEMSYREVARIIGVGPSMFTRLNDGFRPDADALCSLLMWLSPEARISDYVLPGPRATAPRPVSRRRALESVPVPTQP
jgi:transcriptional regulator with XRE-family HTH domain